MLDDAADGEPGRIDVRGSRYQYKVLPPLVGTKQLAGSYLSS